MMRYKNFRLIFILTICIYTMILTIKAQYAYTELSKIGIIKGNTYNLKITSQTSSQYMVIRLIPNLQNLTKCTLSSLSNYKLLINRVLLPINQSLSYINSVVHNKYTNQRFWGAVVGGVALGVATSAQITAGVALHNSNQNAKAIQNLKDAITNSNKAIESLKTAAGQTVTAISALQDQINSQLVPSLNQLGCQMVETTLTLKLNQYFSEISLIFGPNLRDPASETLSIQAISRAFNGDFESLSKTLGYSGADFLDILESDSIRGRIIGVNLEDYFIILQIEYPTMISIPDAKVQEFNIISYNHLGSEWFSIYPSVLLSRGNYLSNIDVSRCTRTTNSYICLSDTSSPISNSILLCSQGNLKSCARTRVVNTYVPRYALSNGVIFANCISMNCRCSDPEFLISQDSHVSNVMISSDDCKEVYLDSIYITVGPKKLNRTMYSSNVEVGGPITINPIDVGNEIADISTSLNKTQHYLDKSNSILNRINLRIVNSSSIIVLIIMASICLILIIGLIIWNCYMYRIINYNRLRSIASSRSSTINTLTN
ncbi:fusion protein [Feline paramyxovirus 163]|uniref:fusion protein n=1 Tax=Feline paramyxovirus 163 TaxID=2486281 RepID=UPI00129F3F16|nr:fusion protein [Feline paramyxovirus 163]BBG92172.1 fusion protein [Feline paramyxovirus 163]